MQAVGLKSFIEQNPEVSYQLFPRRKDCRISAEEMKNKIEFSDDVYPEMNAKPKNFFLQYIELLDNRKEGKITPLIVICTLHCNMQYLSTKYKTLNRESVNTYGRCIRPVTS